MKHTAITLDDKYAVEIEEVHLTGTQALVRLPLLQHTLDRASGRNTAGFISGYRGSPLGGLDIQLFAAKKHLEEHHIHFQPGLNEEAAATAVWGSQQVPLLQEAKYDGVFALWYGKGPGVDRSGDALKHANFAGTSPNGGVLLCAGDDHACKSSTVPHQSEPAFIAALIPVLVPAGVEDIITLGLHGWAMSRYSGLYTGFKTVADVVETSTTIAFDLHGFRPVLPPRPPEARHFIRLHDAPLEMEHRIHAFGLPSVRDYVRANGLDRVLRRDKNARLGIITAGKSSRDLAEALADLGLEGADAGLAVLKLALTWPIVPETIRDFSQGLDEILIVEEKQPIIENQVKEILYGSANAPRITGKHDDAGKWLLRASSELSADDIARALVRRLGHAAETETVRARLATLAAKEAALKSLDPAVVRKPYFCSGCPHNTSTKVIDGSRALAGIGCHFMAMWMDRHTDTYSQMGGEGVAWIGQAPFTEEKHVFVNIGDGTYIHSGILAIRAAVAAGVNATYKVLFNDAVAMTGGQHLDGIFTPARITRQLAAEGVRRIDVVTDEPEKYATVTDLAPGVQVHHRRDLPEVERALRDTPGITAIVYDQTCASEKRRRRKRGLMVDPAKRAFINARVCEGCGDCSVASNCLSVVPRDTEWGVKREINQSSCNKDFSCIEGFCPSFVTVQGGTLRRAAPAAAHPFSDLPTPSLPPLDRAYGILVAGVGGTGVVTIGALLGTAAYIEGKAASVLDQMGLAQKGGGVWSHIKIAQTPAALHALRITQASADLLLACDLVVGAGAEALATAVAGRTRAVVNTHETITADFVLNPGTRLNVSPLEATIAKVVGAGALDLLEATALATALIGDAIATNLFMLGYAYQRGLVPIGHAAIEQAIVLNGTAVEANKAAFNWGRSAAVDLPRVRELAGLGAAPSAPESLDALIERSAGELVRYQGRRLAQRYRKRIALLRAREQETTGATVLTEAAARNYFKLLAYKDEYEVARLHADPAFRAELAARFEGPFRLEFHLAPPLLAKRDPRTGHLQKRVFGGWMLPVFGVLRHGKFLRGTRLDPFGRSEERRAERALIAEYETLLDELLATLSPANAALALELAALPERIKGFGHVKERNMRETALRRAALLSRYRAAQTALAAE
jgi:indolepyruvate ferredoxin oxidoreductase